MANSFASPQIGRSPELVKVLEKAKEQLESGKFQEALRTLSGYDSEWTRNARGVCYLRMGDTDAAINTLRGLAVTQHLSLRPEAPLIFKINFAAALLLSGNIGGGLGVLDDIRDENQPAVQKLRAAIQRWKASMSFWEKLRWWLGGEPSRPFTLGFPAGEFE
jgi:hypothetical protein